MNFLHIFMASTTIIGLLLVVTSIYTYSKLNAQCTSGSLRTKLQWAIGLGTTFMSLGVGYVICVNMSGCECPFDNNTGDKKKLYGLLISLVVLGSAILPITVGIKNDLNDCNVDIGVLPSMLIGIASLQIALPVIFIVYTMISGMKSKKVEVNEEDDESDESKAAKEESRKSSLDKQMRNKLISRLNKQEADLSHIELNLLNLGNKKPNPDDLRQKELLIREIQNTREKIKGVGQSSSMSSSSSSSSSLPSSSLPSFRPTSFPLV